MTNKVSSEKIWQFCCIDSFALVMAFYICANSCTIDQFKQRIYMWMGLIRLSRFEKNWSRKHTIKSQLHFQIAIAIIKRIHTEYKWHHITKPQMFFYICSQLSKWHHFIYQLFFIILFCKCCLVVFLFAILSL